MPASSETLRTYLAPEETLSAALPATLAGSPARRAAFLGITDRRLLCVAADGTFVDLRLDHVSSVASRPRTRLEWRGTDYRALVVGGGLLATVAFLGLVVVASAAPAMGNVLAPLLALVTVVCLPAAVFVRRYGGDVGYAPHLAGGAGLLAGLGFVGATAVGPTLLTPSLTLLTLGGIALMDYAYRRRSDFDGFDVRRVREREVTVATADGRTVRFRVDPAEEVGRELGRLADGAGPEDRQLAAIES